MFVLYFVKLKSWAMVPPTLIQMKSTRWTILAKLYDEAEHRFETTTNYIISLKNDIDSTQRDHVRRQ